MTTTATHLICDLEPLKMQRGLTQYCIVSMLTVFALGTHFQIKLFKSSTNNQSKSKKKSIKPTFSGCLLLIHQVQLDIPRRIIHVNGLVLRVGA